MKTAMHFHRQLRVLALTIILIPLAGCAAIPAVIKQASWAISGISYLTTKKGPSEHVLSIVVNEDCSFFRVLKAEAICQDKDISGYDTLLVKNINDYF